MSIPGRNLLNTALRVIKSDTASFLKVNGRRKNSKGQWVPTYDDPVPIRGSIQSVPRTLYQTLGLDFQKNYINIYSSMSIQDIGRGTSSDRILFNDKTFVALSSNDWIAIDGWNGVMFVEVQNEQFT